MCGRIYDPGMRPYPPRVRRKSTNPSQSAIDQWGWGRHTVRGGIDPRDQLFVPGVLGVVDVYFEVWQYLLSKDGSPSSLCAAGSTNSSQSAIIQ